MDELKHCVSAHNLKKIDLSHLPHVVEALEDPADGAVAAAHQDLVLLDLAKDVQAAQRAAVAEVEYLQIEKGHNKIPLRNRYSGANAATLQVQHL